jgi:ribosomal protein S18 acetylase RimI-like enzyme
MLDVLKCEGQYFFRVRLISVNEFELLHFVAPRTGKSMSELSFRHPEPSDYQQIIAVVDDWWGGRRMADMLPKLFFVHFRPTCFVAEHNGQIVGFLVGFVSQTFPGEAYIHFAGVHPGFRKDGLGRALYERFFAAAAKMGCRTVRCVTSPVNEGSISFHRRMGFSATKSEKIVDGIPIIEGYDGKGEDRVLFFKSLDAGCS